MRDVVLYPDTPLMQKAEPCTNVGRNEAKLAVDMFGVMDSFDGCGLAGPQVGVAKRIFVLHEPEQDTRMCLINPEILESDGHQVAEEGCLSLPYIYAEVARHQRIHVRALNERGKKLDFEALGLLARIIQHEVDHLEGAVFLDRLDVLTREAKLREWTGIRNQMNATLNGRSRSC